MHVGGGGGFVYGNTATEGSLVALGLPDVLPQVETIIQQVEVEREVEVEVEKIVEVEVNVEKVVEVEVPVETIVEKEVAVEITTTEEVISPVSYVAIGLGVVLIVVAGVLFQRSRGAT